MTFDRPPKDASKDNLLELCKVLREGSKTTDELIEEVSQGKTIVRDNIRYGIRLGFLKETEEGVETTSRGVEASYNRDNPEELAEQFRDGVEEYRLYRTVLEEISSEDGFPVTKSDVLRLFRTSAGLEGSESTLGDAATTFIQTLDAAGFGKYVVGRGGKETRLEVSEDFDILVDQMVDPSGPEEDSEENILDEQSQSPVDEVSVPTNTASPSPIQINIELSGDEDPDRVENLIAGVRRGLTRELDESDANLSSKDTEQDESSDDTGEETSDSDRETDSEVDEEADSTNSDQSLDTFVGSGANNENK